MIILQLCNNLIIYTYTNDVQNGSLNLFEIENAK